MQHLALIRNLFNDMTLFFRGTDGVGLNELADNYSDESIFLAFMSNLEEALRVPYMDVMMQCYQFYKGYCGRELSEEEWDAIVTGIQEFNRKWGNNRWCTGLILALLGLLDEENKEYAAAKTQENGSVEMQEQESVAEGEEAFEEPGTDQQEPVAA